MSTTVSSERLEELGHRHAITTVVTRYASALDTKDYRLLRSCFSDDFTAKYRQLQFGGPEALCDYMEGVHRYIDASQHRLSNIVVDLDGITAKARTYVEAILIRVNHPVGPRYFVYGQYDDELSYEAGMWLIRYRQFSEMWSHGNREALIAE